MCLALSAVSGKRRRSVWPCHRQIRESSLSLDGVMRKSRQQTLPKSHMEGDFFR